MEKFGKKIRAAFLADGASYFHDNASISIFLKNKKDSIKILFSTHLAQWIYRDFGLFHAQGVLHFFLPPLRWRSPRILPSSNGDVERGGARRSPKFPNIGLILHEAQNPYFEKNHYLSTDAQSLLAPGNVQTLVLNGPCPEATNAIPLMEQKNEKHLLASFRSFLAGLPGIHGFHALMGNLFLAKTYYRFLNWVQTLRPLHLEKAILDYDILVPKALSFALAFLKIRTFAIQERPIGSFCNYIYGVLVDVYLFSGKIFRERGMRNPSLIFEQGVNFGMWRTSLFRQKKTDDLFRSFLKQKNISRPRFDRCISFIGYWHGRQENQTPLVNPTASEVFYKAVEITAQAFPTALILLRMKILKGDDAAILLERFRGLDNVVHCDDYGIQNLSYALVKNSDVVVSVQTSLADEALAFGKKVLILDYISLSAGMCRRVLPKEFHFLLVSRQKDILPAIRRILSGNPTMLRRYRQLRERMLGEVPCQSPAAVNKALARLLVAHG